MESEIVENIKCFQCKHELYDNLNITYNAVTNMTVLWNKYQIIVYKGLDFEYSIFMFVSEFLIRHLIISKKHLICLDCDGKVYTTSLKTHSAQKRFKSSFVLRDEDVLTCKQLSEDITVSVKSLENKYYFSIYQTDAQFVVNTRLLLRTKDLRLTETSQDKCLLSLCPISKENFNLIVKLFNTCDMYKDHQIAVISMDKMTVYGCLVSPNMSEGEISLTKIYSSSSEICNIEIVNALTVDIIIGLTIGTIIKLSLRNSFKVKEIIHLNTAIYKFTTFKNTLIYTDGLSLWKTDYTLSDTDVNFTNFLVKNIKDIITIGDLLMCTTWNKLIYRFPIDNKNLFSKTSSTDEYCPAKALFSNPMFGPKVIFKEVEMNNAVMKDIHLETNRLAAFALSNRPDIMNKLIHTKVIVYETYSEVKDNDKIILSDELCEYFKDGTYLFFIKISIVDDENINNSILSNVLSDLNVHVILSSENNVLKTVSVKVKDVLKSIRILIPLHMRTMENTTKIKVHIKLVSIIPGAYDPKQTLWAVLYKKRVFLNLEHFINVNLISKTDISYKKPKDCLEELIFKAACRNHGDLFQFTDILKFLKNTTEWSLYVKLPENYEEMLKKPEYYQERFNADKANYLLKQFSCEEFLRSRRNIYFEIFNRKVKLEVLTDETSGPLLKVTSDYFDMLTAFSIRNYFSDMIYNELKGCGPGKQFINSAFYTSVNNLRKKIKESMSEDDFFIIAERFEKNIISALPI